MGYTISVYTKGWIENPNPEVLSDDVFGHYILQPKRFNFDELKRKGYTEIEPDLQRPVEEWGYRGTQIYETSRGVGLFGKELWENKNPIVVKKWMEWMLENEYPESDYIEHQKLIEALKLYNESWIWTLY